MVDDNFEARAKDVEAQGRARYGDGWTAIVAAVQRLQPTQEAIHRTLADPNAVDVFAAAGKEYLLREMSDGNKQSEISYSSIRTAERERYARLKGRQTE